MIAFVDMTEDEYEVCINRVFDSHVLDKTWAENVSLKRGKELSDKIREEDLPDGYKTKDNFFFNLIA